MTYGDMRATHYAMAPFAYKEVIKRNLNKADRAHGLLTKIIAERGIAECEENHTAVIKEARRRYGLMASLGFAPIVIQIISFMLPIFLRWLAEQLIEKKRRGGKPADVDRFMQQMAEQVQL